MNRPSSAQNAVALAYQTGDLAPKVVAKGRGLVAEEIIKRAKEHGVFVHESRELVALLMQVDLEAALDKYIDATTEDIRVLRRDNRVRYQSVERRPENRIVVTLADAADLDKAHELIATAEPDFAYDP